MRQRNIKNLSERIEQNSRLLIEEPGDCKGRWAEIFGNGNPIYLEIGCGKGNFITKHAFAEPDCNFIACEGQMSVVLRALEKAEASGSGNLRVFIDFVNDLEDYFEVSNQLGHPLEHFRHECILFLFRSPKSGRLLKIYRVNSVCFHIEFFPVLRLMVGLLIFIVGCKGGRQMFFNLRIKMFPRPLRR